VAEDSTLHAGELESLARLRFAKLTRAELRVLQSAPKGESAGCGPSSDFWDSTNDPANAESWGSEREIRAELIRWLCVDEGAQKKVDKRGVWVGAARIAGKLDLSYATVPFPLRLERCRFTDDAKLTYVKIPEVCLNGSSTRCLLAEGAEVKGNFLLQKGFFAEGEVRLIAALIGGTLNCEGSTFDNSAGCSDQREEDHRGIAISADRIKVEGNISLRKGFVARGTVMLGGARVGGDLSCRSARFSNPHGTALSAENITVGGNCFLYDGFSAEGVVDLFGARIGGNLNCYDGTFNKVVLNSANVKGMFVWSKINKADLAELNLRNAAVGSLADDEASWPRTGRLFPDGFVYERISDAPPEDDITGEPVTHSPKDAGTRLRWLDRQRQFTPQPYRQLAKVLRESGDEEGAKEVLFQMKQRGRRGLLTWVWEGAAGYGVYPEWAAWELLALIAFSTLIFWRAKRVGLMVPTDRQAYDDDKKLLPHYPRFNPLIYVIESCVPLLKLGMADRWQADPSQPTPSLSSSTRRWWTDLLERSRVHLSTRASRLRCFRWFIVIAGWLLTVLFLAAVTNMLKIGQ
jgi:hypothetical protein